MAIDSTRGKSVIRVSEKFFRSAGVDELKEDYSKAEKFLGWKPEVELEGLVKIMMRYELSGTL